MADQRETASTIWEGVLAEESRRELTDRDVSVRGMAASGPYRWCHGESIDAQRLHIWNVVSDVASPDDSWDDYRLIARQILRDDQAAVRSASHVFPRWWVGASMTNSPMKISPGPPSRRPM